MKKILSLFLSFSLSVTLLSGLTSCIRKTPSQTTGSSSVATTAPPPSGEIPDVPDVPTAPDIGKDFFIQVNEGWCELRYRQNDAWNEDTLTIPAYYQGSPVKAIGVAALRDITNLKTVILPDTMRIIGVNVFMGCNQIEYNFYGGALYLGTQTNPYFALIRAENKEITSCEFHPDTKIVAENAFEDCTSLQSVTLNDKLIYLGENAFLNCNRIEYTEYQDSFYLGSATNPYFSLVKRKESGTPKCVLHADTKRIESGAFSQREITSITFPQGLRFIATNAFDSATGNFDVTIPDGVCVESRAFYSARIHSITISKNADLQAYALRSTFVQTATFEEGCTKVSPGLFYGSFSLTSVHLPESMLHIGNAAFRQCSKLQNIDLPSNLIRLGKEAFLSCPAITAVTFPTTLTEIGSYAFSDCDGLTSLYLPEHITQIGENAFSYCDRLKSIIIDAHITVLSPSILENSKELETLQLPGTLKKIDSYALAQCTKLKIITVPEGVTEIGKGAFSSCRSLKAINLPRSLQKIGEGAFSWGSHLVFTATITYPGTAQEFARIQKLSSSFNGKLDYMKNVIYNADPIID